MHSTLPQVKPTTARPTLQERPALACPRCHGLMYRDVTSDTYGGTRSYAVLYVCRACGHTLYPNAPVTAVSDLEAERKAADTRLAGRHNNLGHYAQKGRVV